MLPEVLELQSGDPRFFGNKSYQMRRNSLAWAPRT
jgi:hypothetical protein